MDITTLTEQRDALKTDMQATLDKAKADDRDLTADEQEYFAEADKELADLAIRIDTLQQAQGDTPAAADPSAIVEQFAAADAGQYVSALLRRRPTDADVTAELERINGIRDVCEAAGLSADAWIKAGLSTEQMSLVATEMRAAVDQHIDTHQPPADPKPAFSTAKIYADRRLATVR